MFSRLLRQLWRDSLIPDRSESTVTTRPGNRALVFLLSLSLVAAAACRQEPPLLLTIRAGLLLDGRGGQLHDVVVTVTGNRISAISPYRGGTVNYDLSRYTVLPGLIDAHIHLAGYFNRKGGMSRSDDGETPEQRRAGRAANRLATLRAGFTTVASMGSDLDREFRRAVEKGELPGPRVLTSLNPFQDTSLTEVVLRSELRHRKSSDADFIKIFNSNSVWAGGRSVWSAAKLATLCNSARKLGLRTVVHVQSDESIRAAVAAGCDQLEHGLYATGEVLQLVAAKGLYFDPQCKLVVQNYLDHRAAFAGFRGYDSVGFAYMARWVPAMPLVVRKALQVPGLKVLYGTDATAGAHGRNGEDLICWVREAGASPMQALVAATSVNAAALGLGDEIGSLAPGYQADVIALEGNPLEEIEAVRRVRFVMKGGKVAPGLTAPASSAPPGG